jgi:hypothetical protein
VWAYTYKWKKMEGIEVMGGACRPDLGLEAFHGHSAVYLSYCDSRHVVITTNSSFSPFESTSVRLRV